MGMLGQVLIYKHKQFYASFSIPNLLENNISLTNRIDLEKSASEAKHYYLMTGMTFITSPKISIQPNILFKYVKNAPFDVDLNFNIIYDQRITGGISYRTGGDRSGGGNRLIFYWLIRFSNLRWALVMILLFQKLVKKPVVLLKSLLALIFLKN